MLLIRQISKKSLHTVICYTHTANKPISPKKKQLTETQNTVDSRKNEPAKEQKKSSTTPSARENITGALHAMFSTRREKEKREVEQEKRDRTETGRTGN